MDFNDMVKEIRSKYQDIDTDFSFLNRLAVVTFEKDRRNNISGKCRFGNVYRHREYESVISEGETWICDLTESTNTYGTYFAKGIVKVDNSFLFDLTKDQMQMLADAMWNGHKDYFEPMFEERYMPKIEERAKEIAAESVSEMEKEKDAAISKLEEELADLKRRNSELTTMISDRSISEDRMQIPSDKDRVSVRRVSPDTLYSEAFDGRYEVRFSADRKRLLIMPDDRGRIESRDRTIRLGRLDDIMPYIRNEMLKSECDRDGNMTVSLV